MVRNRHQSRINSSFDLANLVNGGFRPAFLFDEVKFAKSLGNVKIRLLRPCR